MSETSSELTRGRDHVMELCAASGVFVCIRCSGIHRSMGTHISKVKSVDLDMWTPEQMKVRLPQVLIAVT